MSIEWVLVWILVIAQGPDQKPTYSPPFKTAAECEKVRTAARAFSSCVEVHILAPKGVQ